MAHYCIRWSFNEEVSQDQRRNTPLGIATSSNGQFLIADYYTLKVFDSNGNFHMSLRPQFETTSYIYDVAISDVHDTIYLLVTQLMSPRISSPEKFEVQVFNKTLDFHLRFPVGKGSSFNRLTFGDSKVFILRNIKWLIHTMQRWASYGLGLRPILSLVQCRFTTSCQL